MLPKEYILKEVRIIIKLFNYLKSITFHFCENEREYHALLNLLHIPKFKLIIIHILYKYLKMKLVDK
jgi:16S rRNA C1402 (ribose-2'-O) methylase RsmI